jgi:hypothetical protein
VFTDELPVVSLNVEVSMSLAAAQASHAQDLPKRPVLALTTTYSVDLAYQAYPLACNCRSFTDIAFVDFTDTSRDWATNGVVSAVEYARLLGRQPQSLNDFKHSCARLLAAGQLPMSEAECEQRREAFGRSLKIIR